MFQLPAAPAEDCAAFHESNRPIDEPPLDDDLNDILKSALRTIAASPVTCMCREVLQETSEKEAAKKAPAADAAVDAETVAQFRYSFFFFSLRCRATSCAAPRRRWSA